MERHAWPVSIHLILGFLVGSFSSASSIARVRADDSVPAASAGAEGARVWATQCAACHGQEGEGVAGEYDKPLVGSRSVDQLARYIERRMPEDDPDLCRGDDAANVARWMHETFYSPIAQARRRPPRVSVTRLTVEQFRQAVADLVASEDPPAPLDEPGLDAKYFDDIRPGRNSILERREAEVALEFGPGRQPGDVDDRGFTTRWEGSVLAPETGAYTFVVRTNHAARLWVNDRENALIDAWVKSGDETEYRGALFLLGGRRYSLRLDFSSRRQGVQDQDKVKSVEGYVELLWERPESARERIAPRYLSSQSVPEVFVVDAPFPPDDRSEGYERGHVATKAWDDAVTRAALAAAARIATQKASLLSDPSRRDEVMEWARGFVERAFRRPLEPLECEVYVDRQLCEATDLVAAVKRVVALTIKSPRFLYLGRGDADDPWVVAERIAAMLWDSIPDRGLLEAAAAGHLATDEDVGAQIERCLRDLRARAKIGRALHAWLDIEHVPEIDKDVAAHPGFDASVATDLRSSLDLFLEEIVWGTEPDFRRFFLETEIPVSERLAAFYGIGSAGDEARSPTEFWSAELSPERAGVLTHPYLLSRLAYRDVTSPIHRGVFIVRGVLGRGLRPPPSAAAPLAPDLHPGLTTRERVVLQTSPEMCRTCHDAINPLGFALEGFDAVGRFRTTEYDRPVDATGSYEEPGGAVVPFDGARALGEIVAASDETHRAFVVTMFHQLVRQPIFAYGGDTPESLRRAFVEDTFDVRRLVARIVTTAALHRTGDGPDAAAARPREVRTY